MHDTDLYFITVVTFEGYGLVVGLDIDASLIGVVGLRAVAFGQDPAGLIFSAAEATDPGYRPGAAFVPLSEVGFSALIQGF